MHPRRLAISHRACVLVRSSRDILYYKTFQVRRPSADKIIDVYVAILEYSIELRKVLDQGNLCTLLLPFTLYAAKLQPV